MSSSNRTTSKGGKGSKTDNKTHKSDKSDTGKGSDKQQASRDNTHAKSEDPFIKDKVKKLMEMSQRSEEEVCLALHDCDYDENAAMNMLLENMGQGEWETRVKKKKNRQASASKQEKIEESAGGDDWNDVPSAGGGGGAGNGNEKDKPRNKSGPPRLHGRHNDSRGWRGREKQENERNLEEGGGGGRDFHRDRRGRPGGSTRGPGGGRGRGGGRAGGRYPPRGSRSNAYNKPIDTWDNSNTWDNSTVAATNHTENWDDFPGTDEWTTEEYTGSLADTKVFTPSVAPPIDAINEASSNIGLSMDNAVINTGQQLGQNLQAGAGQLPSQSPVQIGGTLNAAQTQYLNQLTQQNSENLKQYGSAHTYHAQNSSQVYNTGANTTANQTYASNQQYVSSPSGYVNSSYQTGNNNYNAAEQQATQQPVRTKTQRARVPPPSKIPASAVEMPGDLNSSIGYLDVQFGAMDFMSDTNSFDSVNDNKYGSSNPSGLDNTAVTSTGNMDLNTNQNSTLDAYSPKSNTQSSISSALTQSLTESIPQTSEHLTNAYNTAPRSSTTGSTATPSVTPSGLDIGKQSESHTYSQQSTYNSYQQKTNTYNASTYSGTQTSNSYVSNQANSNYANSQAAPYNTPYQNAYSSAASYQSNTNAGAFPSISQANSYPSNNQSYQQNSSQSVYGANTGLSNSSNLGNTTTSQYNSYSSASNHKLSKDSYDSTSNAVSNTQTTTSSNVTSTTALSLSQSTVSVTKSTTTLAAKNSSSVVSNIPPGVAPVMSTPYIMGQVPYFQPPVYSYEEVQMLQQRMPHMTTPYYDMSYQTPTTLAAVRDGALGNVGYSMSSDGRFTRGDNNASPVPSTLSQQTTSLTQGHQAQPILAGTGHPYFFTALNTFPNYQFGMYTQLPAATNAHGSSNSTQYPKPATYGSGYGSYDTLSQTQDYNKTGYVGNNQGQKGGGVNATSTGSSGNDLSMYGKSHAALGKVNSYDKQGFHSGTPPPFAGTLHGQNAGLAPSGTGYGPQVYIPTMTPHQQQLSTQLMHQPLHQMDVRHQGRRVDSGNNSGNRSQSSNPAKGGAKQPYQTSYWNQA
ncbi:protein lingerer isoform X1 [Tribolium castaneum]|uniref:protein lingerer isoform X1 n=1 Tax=Tribolium castaneum TaxID=7070 RepID=UPI0030FE59FF